MITDEDVEKAVEFLRENARIAAQARANRIYMEEFRKVVKAEVMVANKELPLGAQEREAYDSTRYAEHLLALKTAVEEDEFFRWKMVAAEAKIEAWRTQQANLRAEGKAYR